VGTYLPHYAASEHVTFIFIAVDITTPHKLQILTTNKKTKIVLFFLLGDSPVSGFYVLTFRNTMSVPTSTQPMKLDKTGCSEKLQHQIQTPGNHPRERIQHSQQGESLKSRQKLILSDSFINTFMNIRLMKMQF
jgi:hypothetical protein